MQVNNFRTTEMVLNSCYFQVFYKDNEKGDLCIIFLNSDRIHFCTDCKPRNSEASVAGMVEDTPGSSSNECCMHWTLSKDIPGAETMLPTK